MTASPFIPTEAAEQVFGDIALARQLLEALERGDAIADLDDAADWLTETLGRPRKANVKRSLQRMAERGALSLDPITIPPWARLALTGAPAPDAGGKAGKVRIPLDRLEPNPWNPRKAFDPDALAELGQSILTAGLAHDALVRPHPDKPGLFQIVAGERRWRAARLLADQGEYSTYFDPADGLPCDVRDLTDAQARALTYAENAVRKDPTGIEQCDALAADKAALEAEGGDVGAYLHAMAGSLGYRNIRPVQHMILVGEKLIDQGREAFASGAMKLAHARVIAGADPAIQCELVSGFVARKPGFTTEGDLSKRRQEQELLAEVTATSAGRIEARRSTPLEEAESGPAEAGLVDVGHAKVAASFVTEEEAALGASPRQAPPACDQAPERPATQNDPSMFSLSTSELLLAVGKGVAEGWMAIEAHPAKGRMHSSNVRGAMDAFVALMNKARRAALNAGHPHLGSFHPPADTLEPTIYGGPMSNLWKGGDRPSRSIRIAIQYHCTARAPESDPAPSAPDVQGNYAPQEIVTFIDGVKGRQAGHEGDEVAALLAVALDGQWRVGWRIRLGAVHREQPPQRSKRAKHTSRAAALEAARIACARELAAIDANQTVSDAKTRAHKALIAMSNAHPKVAEIAHSAGAIAPNP